MKEKTLKEILAHLIALRETCVLPHQQEEYEQYLVNARKNLNLATGETYLQSLFGQNPDDSTPPSPTS